PATCELALVAALLGRPLEVAGAGPYAGLAQGPQGLLAVLAREVILPWRYACPFTGAEMGALAAARLLGQWRRLIDGNRPVGAIHGVARWKRGTLDALLWAGRGRPPYGGQGKGRVLVWQARTPARVLARLAGPVGEIEDGPIRSAGLGAHCVPPLSIVVDELGPYFDPARESGLERLLARAAFPPDLLARAAALRGAIVAGGVGKYGAGGGALAAWPADGRRRVLVVGQVADDRAMALGGAGCTNLALLQAARRLEPQAHIIWRPHPDVVAGLRPGALPPDQVRALADAEAAEAPIAGLLAGADAVHVISSLAGFEALLRGCAVTVHGLPFYAGWGLTRDLAITPARRRRRLALDELVAAALILYPRYLDPLTRLPCPPEVLVARLVAGVGQRGLGWPLVALRRWQGRLRRWLAARA
ncbi:MAG TPA: beta-3-deoxy-D-manno-oct-2-ulosonic acid transferase, partial [Novosphingobium sp.]|nr:beta-3-deoxy-D-manno-oct-2-ulosonic acid transferase [Novosphingobium sp.]